MTCVRHRLQSLPWVPGVIGAVMSLLLASGCATRSTSHDDAAPDRGPRDAVFEAVGRDGEAGTEGGCIKPRDMAGGEAATDGHLDVSPSLDSNGPDVTPPQDVGAVDGPPPDTGALDAPSLDTAGEGTPKKCPAGMVLITSKLCIDPFEASRSDATQVSQGTQTGAARSKAGVIPWHSWTLTRTEAATACAKAGKRLCGAAEWKAACSGPKKTAYSYGNTYSPTICNGIDTYCYCGAGSPCAGVTPCPYAHCFASPPPGGVPALGCGAAFDVMPTGSHLKCENGLGVHDMNGNVWEVVTSTDGLDHFRGGAYNCGNSQILHRCDYDATWGPSARGFRCCADPKAP